MSTSLDAAHVGPGQTEASRAPADPDARAFFERTPPDSYLEEWSRRLTRPDEEPEAGLISVTIIRLHDEYLAVPTAALVEVALPQPIHVVPHRTSRSLLGIVNIRGQLHLCASLHGLLDIEPPGTPASNDAVPRSDAPRMIILHDGRAAWVLPVEEVVGIQTLAPSSLRDVPATLARGPRVSRAVFDWGGRTVGLVDEHRLCEALGGLSA